MVWPLLATSRALHDRSGALVQHGDAEAAARDHHHRVVHHDGWHVELTDGAVHVIPPPWVDPDQTPRPNTNPERATVLAAIPRRPGHDRR